MPKYFLEQHTRWCDVGDGVILLNLRTHKYFALDRATSDSLHLVVNNWPTPGFPETNVRSPELPALIHSLLQKNLISKVPPLSRTTISSGALPQYDGLDFRGRTRPEPTIRARHVLHFWAAFALTKFQLRFLSLDAIAQGIKHRNERSATSSSTINENHIRDLINIFRRLRQFAYTARNRCLLDSLVLVHFLHQAGIASTWCIGVEARPFSAHSWVQYRGLVLTDPMHKALQYTPILVV